MVITLGQRQHDQLVYIAFSGKVEWMDLQPHDLKSRLYFHLHQDKPPTLSFIRNLCGISPVTGFI